MKKCGFALLMLLAACRPEPGDADYENQGQSTRPDAGVDPNAGGLPGPFPFQEGQRRLVVGFYEGGRSEEVAIDNTTTHVYLYENTVTLEAANGDHVEGRSSDLVVHAGKAWLGFGIHWDTARNLDAWKTLHVSLKSADPGFAEVTVAMNDTAKSFQLPVKKYGYKNDGEWHHLAIPLSDYVAVGLKLNAVNSPFALFSGQGQPADKLLLDNVYFTAD